MGLLGSYDDRAREPVSRPIRRFRLESLTEDRRGAIIDYAGVRLSVACQPGTYVIGGLVNVQVDDHNRPMLVLGPAEEAGIHDRENGLTPEQVTAMGGLMPEPIDPETQKLIDEFPGRIAANEQALKEAEEARKQAAAETSKTLGELDGKLGAFQTVLVEVQGDASQASAKADQAAGKADTASGKADEASKKAGQAEKVAVQAVTAANGKNKIWTSPGTPSGSVAAVEGDIWWQTSGGAVIGQWQYKDGRWVATQINSSVIANLDVGKLTAGNAMISEAVINKLWAGGLAAKTAQFQSVVVAPGNLIENGYGEKNEPRGSWSYKKEEHPDSGAKGMWVNPSNNSLVVPAPTRSGEDLVLTWWVRANYWVAYKIAIRCLAESGPDLSYTYRGGSFSANSSWKKENLIIKRDWLAAGTTQIEIVFLDWGNAYSRPAIAALDLRPQVGAVMIADGAVNADKILAGSIGTKELTADDIAGKRFVGSTFASASTTSTWNNTIMNPSGIHVYKNGVEQVRLSADTPGGLAVYNEQSKMLTPLPGIVFGMKVFAREYGGSGQAINSNGSIQYHWFEAPYYATSDRLVVWSSVRMDCDPWRIIYRLVVQDKTTGRMLNTGDWGDASLSGSNVPHLVDGTVSGRSYRIGFEVRREGGSPGYKSRPGTGAWPKVTHISAFVLPSSMAEK
ncbi:hypothetical protein [Actinotignum sp. GS-2025c]|uniref:hypothetical protein n=1 Tax=Actinotignum sp. GS-2025c TaxID=3427276 RepID=UPI003F462E32